MKAVNTTKTRDLAGCLAVAETRAQRMIGLLGKGGLAADEALWIRPCNGIHTFGMKFPIDVVFLTEDQVVLEVKREVPPNRLTRVYFNAASVLELPAGKLDATETAVGDRVEIS